ncbi:MAG: AAA family ATPase [Clostridia bacterium]|nr:AAA family ATPase [Clostridia bacterium]
MKLKKIIIKNYKNLKDITINLPDSNIVAFIGNNGSGKSNILELIAQVFAYTKNSLQKGKVFPPPNVDECEIDYNIDGNNYALKYISGGVSIFNDAAEKVKKEDIEDVLPKSIFLYYAGETKRLAEVEEKIIDNKYNERLKKNHFEGYKFIEYFSTYDLDILLLTVAVYQGELLNHIKEYLGSKSIYCPFNLILKNPTKNKSYSGGEYYGAVGFVQAFFNEFRKYVQRTEEGRENYTMSFVDTDKIKNLAETPSEFFAKMKALKNSGYLDRVIINFHNNFHETILLGNLSEGEKQVLLISLLSKITENDNCLYLLDECDAYLHLEWQRKFSSTFEKLSTNGQIFLTTHSPSTISGLRSENVFKVKDGEVSFINSETYNRSLDEIMQENMDINMRSPEVHLLYDEFKQCIADGNKEKAEKIISKLKQILDEDDPLFIKLRLVMRRL